MEIFYIFGLWALIVALAPFGIWKLKARVSDLEDKLARLEMLQKDSVSPKSVAAIQPITTAPPSIWPQRTETPEPARQREPSLPPMQEFLRPPIPTETPNPTMPEIFYSVPEPIATPAPRPAQSYYTPEPSAPFEMPEWITRALTGGRLFVTLGILLLFMGCAMLFKYASQFITVPVEARFVGVALGAIGMIAFGGKQMGKRRDYGLYLQGGGLGILFLTVFTAFKFYSLIPAGVALALLVVIGAATFVLSVYSNAMALSVLAVTGGFLAPIMTSTGNGSHIALFSYYLVINLVILAIAWKKSWRLLNTIGFGFTFAIASLWGGQYYVPEFYVSVQSFLAAYFLLYTGIGLLYASRSEPRFSNPIDFASILGVPLVGCGLQFALVHAIPHGAAISCALLGVFYAGLYVVLDRSPNAGLKTLTLPFKWLSLLFFTLAIPFAFSSHSTAMLWSMEGFAMLCVMNKMRDRFYGYAGVAVLLASDVFMMPVLQWQGAGIPFANVFFLSALVMALTHLAAAHVLKTQQVMEDIRDSAAIFSVVGMGWWFGAGGAEIVSWLQPDHVIVMACLLFASVSALLGYRLKDRVQAPLIDKPVSFVMLGTLAACVLEFLNMAERYHPSQHYGWIVLPVAFAVHYYWLWKEQNTNAVYHVKSFLAVIVLVGFEFGYHFHNVQPYTAHKVAGWLLAAAGGLYLLTIPDHKKFWPLTVLQTLHRHAVGYPLVLWSGLLCLYTLTEPVHAVSGNYIPLLNMVEVSELATLVALFAFYLKTRTKQVLEVFGALSFGFASCLMLRIISLCFGVTYFSPEMWRLPEAMTSITIFWTLIAMGGMILSSRYAIRQGWVLGAGLLGVVVVKLFVIDLANIGTLSRIISFMGVGMLSLLLGYIAPMPAKKE